MGTLFDIPDFDMDSATGLGVLNKRTHFETGIITDTINHRKIHLRDGRLSLDRGYKWDFGSGPAVDTPSMVAASLAHDALYELIRVGKLDRRYRKHVDGVFRDILKSGGVGVVRRTYCYLAVRLFGWTAVREEK